MRARTNVGDMSAKALTVRVTGGVDAAAAARRVLRRLSGEIDEPVAENLRLLVTELVGNSVRHAGVESVVMKVALTDPAVHVEVTDEGPGFEPTSRDERADRESGWGLFLVDRLADRWGVNCHQGATRVWFDLRR